MTVDFDIDASGSVEADLEEGACAIFIQSPKSDSIIRMEDFEMQFFALNCFALVRGLVELCAANSNENTALGDECFQHELPLDEGRVVDILEDNIDFFEFQSGRYQMFKFIPLPTPGNYSFRLTGKTKQRH